MKERFFKLLKWFFIVLGVLFLFELLILSGIIIGFSTSKNTISPNDKPKELQKIIDYAQKYRYEKGIYPDKVNFKARKGQEYKYSTSENGNCFEIILNSKNSEKHYQSCVVEDENSSSTKESYSEIHK